MVLVYFLFLSLSGRRLFLKCAIDEGTIRIFQFLEDGSLQLQHAWRALEGQTLSLGPSRMHLDWSDGYESCVTGGNARKLCLWDVNAEQCTRRIPTHSTSHVTSIKFGKADSSSIFTGFGDGCMAMYDARLKPSDAYSILFRLACDHKKKLTVQGTGKYSVFKKTAVPSLACNRAACLMTSFLRAVATAAFASGISGGQKAPCRRSEHTHKAK